MVADERDYFVTIIIVCVLQSLAQDTKKKKRRELDEDSEYSEDDRGMPMLFSPLSHFR
jgi:hypothetical protein